MIDEKTINERYKKSIEKIRSVLNKNKEFNVDLKNSSIDHFYIENMLYHDIIIDKYRDQLDLNDLENIDHLLDNPIDDHILENINHENMIDIKENIVRSYIENKEYLIGESNKIKNDPSYGYYDELCDQSWYIVFNIVNYEIDITDDQNIYRYGSIDEVLYYELF